MRPLAVKAPTTSAEHLIAAYRAMTAQWLDVVARDVLPGWFATGSIRRGAAMSLRVRALENTFAVAPQAAITETARAVDAKATANFLRLLDVAAGQAPRNDPRADAVRRVLRAGTLASEHKAKVKSRLERVGLSREMGAAVESFRRRNVQLITTLRAEQIDRIGELLDEADAGGWRVEDLAKKIEADTATTRSRAEFLARDQTLKLHADIQQERQTQSGIRQYRWSTSGDERVRGTPGGKWPRGMHYDLDGTLCDWSDPPVTNENGDRNHPGQDYQCRCIAVPVLPDIADLEPIDDFEPA